MFTNSDRKIQGEDIWNKVFITHIQGVLLRSREFKALKFKPREQGIQRTGLERNQIWRPIRAPSFSHVSKNNARDLNPAMADRKNEG